MDITFLSGIITFGLTQLVKYIPWIPINSGQVARVRAVAGFLSLLGTLGTLWITGGLNDTSTAKIAGDAIVAYLVANGVYQHKTTE